MTLRFAAAGNHFPSFVGDGPGDGDPPDGATLGEGPADGEADELWPLDATAALDPDGDGEPDGRMPVPPSRMTATARTATTPAATATGPTDGPRRSSSSRWAWR